MEKICWQITVAAFMQPLQYDLRSPAAKDNSITLIYPRGSNSEHKPGAQNEHQPNAENKGLIWWYDTDKFLYQNQTMDQVDTMNM